MTSGPDRSIGSTPASPGADASSYSSAKGCLTLSGLTVLALAACIVCVLLFVDNG